MLRGIGYLLFGIGLLLLLPKFVKQYKKDNTIENLFEIIGILIITISSIVLGIFEFF